MGGEIPRISRESLALIRRALEPKERLDPWQEVVPGNTNRIPSGIIDSRERLEILASLRKDIYAIKGREVQDQIDSVGDAHQAISPDAIRLYMTPELLSEEAESLLQILVAALADGGLENQESFLIDRSFTDRFDMADAHSAARWFLFTSPAYGEERGVGADRLLVHAAELGELTAQVKFLLSGEAGGSSVEEVRQGVQALSASLGSVALLGASETQMGRNIQLAWARTYHPLPVSGFAEMRAIIDDLSGVLANYQGEQKEALQALISELGAQLDKLESLQVLSAP